MLIQSSDYVKNYFAFNRWILMCAGLWTPDYQWMISRVIYKIYAIFVFLFVNLYFTSTEFLSVKDTYTNYNFLIKNVNFGLTHFMGGLKCVFWFYRSHHFMHIMQTLESEEFYYENSGDFDPGKISRNAKRTGIKYTLSFFLLAHLTLSSSYIPPLITVLFNPTYTEDALGNKTFDQSLPYFSWIPFTYDTPGKYLLAIGYQAGPMFSYAYSIVGMDTLFMNIMNYIGAHMQILHGAFRTLRERCARRINGPLLSEDALHNSEALTEEMNKEMKKSIRHLQTVIGLCEKLESIHKYLTLVQVLATLFILCTSLFLVSTTPVNSKQFAAETVYMVAMGFQLTLYCWFGNEVTLKALELPNAIWENDWLEAPRSFRTNMLITMLRMKRPLHLTVGKFAPLTLATFVAILKASYSFFAVLKKVND